MHTLSPRLMAPPAEVRPAAKAILSPHRPGFADPVERAVEDVGARLRRPVLGRSVREKGGRGPSPDPLVEWDTADKTGVPGVGAISDWLVVCAGHGIGHSRSVVKATVFVAVSHWIWVVGGVGAG